MKRRRHGFSLPLIMGVAFAMSAPVVWAQPGGSTGKITVPSETCTAAFQLQWHGYFRTPESDGRPGYKFYALGVDSLCRHELKGALHLFRLAGSWGYKPAEYTLGVLYFRGATGTANRPLGAAWMQLAADTGIPTYVKARDLVARVLTADEIAQRDQWHEKLESTYGAAAQRRAKWQWKLARNAEIGSHLGHPMAPVTTLYSDTGPLLAQYYRRMHETDDPYAGIDGFLTGRATVGPLQQVGKSSSSQQSTKADVVPASAQSAPSPAQPSGTQR